MKKKILLGLVILLSVAGYFAWTSYNRTAENMSDRKTELQLGAEELLTQFQSDMDMSMKALADKTLEVSGTVHSVDEAGGMKNVYLETGDPMALIACELENTQELRGIEPGAMIRIKGQCTGYLGDDLMAGDVVMVRCIIIK